MASGGADDTGISRPAALETGRPNQLPAKRSRHGYSIAAQPNYDAIKSKQNAAWASGDYARIGVTLQITGE